MVKFGSEEFGGYILGENPTIPNINPLKIEKKVSNNDSLKRGVKSNSFQPIVQQNVANLVDVRTTANGLMNVFSDKFSSNVSNFTAEQDNTFKINTNKKTGLSQILSTSGAFVSSEFLVTGRNFNSISSFPQNVNLNTEFSNNASSRIFSLNNSVNFNFTFLSNLLRRGVGTSLLNIDNKQFGFSEITAITDSVYRLNSFVNKSNIRSKTIVNDDIVLTNTFFSPVFDGTQNLVRTGREILVISDTTDFRLKLVTGSSFSTDVTLLENSLARSVGNELLLIGIDFIKPVYSIVASNNILIRNFYKDKSNMGELTFGTDVFGLGQNIHGKFLIPNTFAFRSLGDRVLTNKPIYNIIPIGRGSAKGTVLFKTLFNNGITSRTFDAEIVSLPILYKNISLTRTFDGRIVSKLARDINAFRLLTEWAIGQRQLGTTIEETREWSALELVYQFENFEFQKDDPEFYTVQEATNNLKARSEKVSVRELIDGGFTGVDLSGEGNTFNIRAPFDRDDVRPVDEWFVNSVDVENISRDTNTFEVELELVPEKSKEFDNEYGTFESPEIQSPSASQWTFEFEFGTIATRRVTVETTESSSGTLDVQELQLVLQPEQVRIFEENVSHLNLVYERSVPDGFDIVDDTSSDERNTVQISPPANVDESVVEGEYSFVSWETEWRAGTFVCTWEVATDEN